jgi:hypothetical protein
VATNHSLYDINHLISSSNDHLISSIYVFLGSALSNDDYSEPSDTVLPVTTPKRAIDVTLTDLL